MSMATATLKLFSQLSDYLPPGADQNQALIEIGPSTTVDGVITALALPAGKCHLVLLNGVFIPPSERIATPIRPGDALAIWPPVGGG